MKRRDFIKAALAGTAGLMIGTDLIAAKKKAKPNILLIMVDDLGYGDLSCYGARDLKTPNIDRLMAAGLRFDNFYANCCVCSPTRAALLTGRFQEFVGVPGVIRTKDEGNWGHLTADSILLPSLLTKAGYYTSIIGKWHLGLYEPNRPNDRGFDEFHGFLGDMMDDYYDHRRHGFNYMRRNEKILDTAGVHATELFTRWSINSLRKRARSDQPFFQYLAYNAPHTPIQPPEDWLEKVKKREKGISETRAKIVAFIEHLDHGIGQVLGELKDLGLDDNTIIIFTSDNGGLLSKGANNGPYREGKTTIYEGGVKVCTCVAWPGKIKPETRTDFRALTMDLFPTILEATQTGFTHKIEGRSIMPTLLGKRQSPFNRDDYYTWLQGTSKEAMRRGDFKLVRDKAGTPWELYNLKDDPYEKTDLAAKNPEKLKELVEAMQKHLKAAKKVPWQRPIGK